MTRCGRRRRSRSCAATGAARSPPTTSVVRQTRTTAASDSGLLTRTRRPRRSPARSARPAGCTSGRGTTPPGRRRRRARARGRARRPRSGCGWPGTSARTTGRAASPTAVEREHGDGQPQLGPHQPVEVDVTEPGLLVEVTRHRARPHRGGAAARAGDPHPLGRAGRRRAHPQPPLGRRSPIGRRSRVSRSSLVCRRLTCSSDAADDDRAPAVVHPHLADVGQGDEGAAVDPDEAELRPALLEHAERHAHQVRAGRRCAGGRSRRGPARSGSGCG